MCFVQESALNDEGSFFCGTTSPERFVLPWGLLLVVEMLFNYNLIVDKTVQFSK